MNTIIEKQVVNKCTIRFLSKNKKGLSLRFQHRSAKRRDKKMNRLRNYC